LSNKDLAIDILVIVLIITLVLLVKFNARMLFGVEAPIVVIEGRSMLPLFYTGDIVFIKHVPPQDIHVGDIIVYKAYEGNYIVHRVIEVRIVDGKYYYVTKGDNNALPDYFEFGDLPGIPYDRVVGVVVTVNGIPLKIPIVGLLVLAFKAR